MGIGVQALLLMKYLHDEGYLAGMSSVVELGSQQFAPDLPAARQALSTLFPLMNPEHIFLPKDLYGELRFTIYKCIDLDGANNALVFDLNKSLTKQYKFRETFDLVTNHGTTEHAFDQLSCFENVHNLSKLDGLMLHALPSQGYQNHSFFNYHPSFFLDLAAANDYKVLGLYYNIGESLFPYTDSFLEKNQIAATEYVAVFAVLRKLSGAPFVVPFDGRYYFEKQGHDFVPRKHIIGHSRVEVNEFPISKENFSVSPHLPGKTREPITKIVMPVWGKEFTNLFICFVLRSQIESGLLKFDERKNIEYVIVTDAAGAAMISASSFLAALNEVCNVSIIRADQLAGQPSYKRLTSSYNLALSKAVVGDLYIFVTADCFFSREVFRRIKEKSDKYRVVLSPALRVVEETFLSDVVLSGSYSVDGREALAIAIRNEHPMTSSFCINNDRNLMHPLPAQTLSRLESGYVGRWNVMHPIAIRIANPNRGILETIDWCFPLHHIKSWDDVGVLDSIEDGLAVSLTPFNYSQGELYLRGGTPDARLRNLKAWVNLRWALNFHMAQISHPVRLLTTETPSEATIRAAELRVEGIVEPFIKYVRGRKFASVKDFRKLSAVELLQPAVDMQQRSLLLPRLRRKLWATVKSHLRKQMTKSERSSDALPFDTKRS
jgi:hypothetical protein